MLDQDENQDLSDDQLSPINRAKEAEREKFDEMIEQGFSPDEIKAMEQDAINGAIDDKTTPQELAEQNDVSSQTVEEPDFFKQEAAKNAGKGKFRGMLSRNRGKTAIGLGALLISGGGFGLFSFLQGPAQLLHLDAALGKHDSAHTTTISRRISRMVYRSTINSADDRLLLSRSRLGVVQNRVFGGMLDRLQIRHGITFTETAGPVTGNSRPTIVFDLPDGHPLRGRTGTITRLNIAKALGVNASKIPNLDRVGNNGRFSISQLDLTTSELDGVKTWLSRNTGGGSVTRLSPKFATSINKRMFAKTLRLPSIFHPISRASEAIGSRVDNSVLARRLRKQADTERTKKSPKVDERRASARSDLKSKVGGNIIKTAGAAIAVQGVMCMVRDIAGIVPRVYYATVVMPSVINAVSTQGAASQLMSGEDFTAQQIGDVMADLNDAEGRSVWGAKSINSLANGGEGQGTDIDVGAKSAFTTSGSSISGLMGSLGVDDGTGLTEVSDSVSGWACSWPARAVGLIAGVAISIGGVVGGVVTGGTTTAGAVGRVAVQAALAGTISYAVSRILGEFVEGKVGDKVADVCGVEYDKGESDKPEDIEILNAEAYGNCLAYGSRMASNINAASMGGVPISSGDETALLNQTNEKEIAEFKQKGLLERLFSNKEERSLVMTALRPSAESGLSVSNFASMITGLVKTPMSMAGGFISALSPKVHAESSTYDWGFPLVSMPTSIAEDPQYDSPENVKWITENRASVQADRVKNCFGKEIVGEGEQLRAILLENEVNPLSDEYNNANCGDLSSTDWIRTALFVMDDSIAAAMDCYDGAAKTCTEIGMAN